MRLWFTARRRRAGGRRRCSRRPCRSAPGAPTAACVGREGAPVRRPQGPVARAAAEDRPRFRRGGAAQDAGPDEAAGPDLPRAVGGEARREAAGPGQAARPAASIRRICPAARRLRRRADRRAEVARRAAVVAIRKADEGLGRLPSPGSRSASPGRTDVTARRHSRHRGRATGPSGDRPALSAARLCGRTFFAGQRMHRVSRSADRAAALARAGGFTACEHLRSVGCASPFPAFCRACGDRPGPGAGGQRIGRFTSDALGPEAAPTGGGPILRVAAPLDRGGARGGREGGPFVTEVDVADLPVEGSRVGLRLPVGGTRQRRGSGRPGGLWRRGGGRRARRRKAGGGRGRCMIRSPLLAGPPAVCGRQTNGCQAEPSGRETHACLKGA